MKDSATTPPKRRKPLWRRIARGFAITLASLVVLLVAAVGFMHTRWGKEIVRGRIEAKLGAAVNGSVSIGSLDYTFLLGEIHIGHVAIRDAQGRPAIGIAAIDIALDRKSLLHRDPLIDRLALHGLDVAVIETAGGGSNLKTLFKPSKQKASLARIRIAQLSLDGAATISKPDGTMISIRDLALAGAVEARPLAQELDATLAQIGAHVSIAKPGATAKQLDVAIAGVTLGRRATGVDVRVSGVSAGPLAIESVDAHAGLVAGRLAGEQKLALAHARVDRGKLAELLGHEVLRDDVTIDVTVTGPTDRLVLAGAIQTGATKLELDGDADFAAARPKYRVALLGDGVQSSAVVTKKPLPQISTDVRVELRGAGIAHGDVEAQLDLAIHALGVDLTGSGALSRTRAIAANFSLTADPAATVTAAAAAGIHISPKLLAIKGQLPPRLALAVTAEGSLDGELGIKLAPTSLALARGHIGLDGSAVLDHGALRTASAHVSLASLDLASLAALAGKPAKAAGTLSGTIALARDGAKQRADYDVTVALAKPAVTLRARGSADPTSAIAHATISHAGVQLATLDAQLPLGKRGGKLGLVPSGNWKVAADFARRPAADLAALLPEKLRAKLPKGELELHLVVGGTPANPTATLAIAATDAGKQLSVASTLGPSAAAPAIAAAPLAPLGVANGVADRVTGGMTGGMIDIQQTFGAAVETSVTTSAPRLTAGGLTFATKATVALGGDTLAIVDASVAVPSPFASGAFDIKALRAGATVDATIDLPARSFGSLASLGPALAQLDGKLGGQIAGHITARGPLAAPTLAATLRWSGYKTAAGTLGLTELVAYGTPAQLTAKLTHGGALAIDAQVDRSSNDRIAIKASAHAAGAPLLPMLPAFLAAKIGANELGRVHSEMCGSFALVRGAAGMSLEDVDVTGSFDVTGASLALPRSDRRYSDIGLVVTAEPHGLRITAGAHERDVEDRDRRIDANGVLAFESRKPAKLDLSLVAHDWLLFGSQKLGPADAPRAAADFDIAVAADLTKPIASVDATVNSLTLRAPERFERGHYAEVMEDDIIEIRPGMTAGKLPVIVAVSGEPAPKKRHPMDIRVHIPKPIHLNQTPMDLLAHGDLTVTVRDEGVKTRGVLTVDGGTLFLFGHDHDLVDGKLSFTDEHPHGWMEMTFERKLPHSTRRDLAQATPGARITFVGDLTKPKPTLSGAAGGLDDAMAMHNAGHGVYVTRPDMPASETVQAPRGDQLGVMTFLAGNLPKMTFLDRIAAWSDPADSKYGQIKHVEAERYSATETTRVRAVVRPQQPGRSSAEIQVDHLLIHSDRAAAGVGVRAGDRLGGGVGFFVEWSSKD